MAHFTAKIKARTFLLLLSASAFLVLPGLVPREAFLAAAMEKALGLGVTVMRRDVATYGT